MNVGPTIQDHNPPGGRKIGIKERMAFYSLNIKISSEGERYLLIVESSSE